MKKSKTLIIITFFTGLGVSPVKADSFVDYLGINYSKTNISIEDFGSSSVEDEADGFRAFAGTQLKEYLYLEYGVISLGDYGARYDLTAGSLRFVESHEVDFSTNIFCSLHLQKSLADIFNKKTDDYAVLNNVSVYADLGALLWQAKLNMDGELYDSGILLSEYGAEGKDIGLSGYIGLGLAYEVDTRFHIRLGGELFKGIGKGVELKHKDGSTSKYSGRDVGAINLSLIYLF